MTIYIILYSLLLLSAIFEKKNISLSIKKVVLYFFVIVFTLFRGLRWNTGTDWEQYYNVFLEAEWNNIFSYMRNVIVPMDPGYMFFNVLIKSIGGNYTLFLLLTNLFVLMSYFKFALTNSNTPIYVFILLIFSTQFFPVRIGIAVAFIIWGLCNFSQKNHIRIIVYTLIAMSIHLSAIIFIFIWGLIFCKKIPTMLAVAITATLMILVKTEAFNTVLLLIAGILNFANAGIIAYKFEHYLDYGSHGIIAIASSITSIIYIASLIPFGYMVNRITPIKEKDNYIFLYNTYFVFAMMAIVFSSDNMLNLKRLQNYLMFAFPILFSMFIYLGKQRYPIFRIGFTILFIGYALFRSYMLFFGGHLDLHFPYISIFHDNSIR